MISVLVNTLSDTPLCWSFPFRERGDYVPYTVRGCVGLWTCDRLRGEKVTRHLGGQGSTEAGAMLARRFYITLRYRHSSRATQQSAIPSPGTRVLKGLRGVRKLFSTRIQNLTMFIKSIQAVAKRRARSSKAFTHSCLSGFAESVEPRWVYLISPNTVLIPLCYKRRETDMYAELYIYICLSGGQWAIDT